MPLYPYTPILYKNFPSTNLLYTYMYIYAYIAKYLTNKMAKPKQKIVDLPTNTFLLLSNQHTLPLFTRSTLQAHPL